MIAPEPKGMGRLINSGPDLVSRDSMFGFNCIGYIKVNQVKGIAGLPFRTHVISVLDTAMNCFISYIGRKAAPLREMGRRS
jgi:hypothetical protein